MRFIEFEVVTRLIKAEVDGMNGDIFWEYRDENVAHDNVVDANPL